MNWKFWNIWRHHGLSLIFESWTLLTSKKNINFDLFICLYFKKTNNIRKSKNPFRIHLFCPYFVTANSLATLSGYHFSSLVRELRRTTLHMSEGAGFLLPLRHSRHLTANQIFTIEFWDMSFFGSSRCSFCSEIELQFPDWDPTQGRSATCHMADYCLQTLRRAGLVRNVFNSFFKEFYTILSFIYCKKIHIVLQCTCLTGLNLLQVNLVCSYKKINKSLYFNLCLKYKSNINCKYCC